MKRDPSATQRGVRCANEEKAALLRLGCGGREAAGKLPQRRRDTEQAMLNSGLGTEIGGNFGMVAFFGKGQGGFAIFGGGMGVGAVSNEELDDFEIAVGRGFEQRRMAFGIAIVHVGATFNEPLSDRDMIAGNGAGERGVASAIPGKGVDVGAFRVEIARDL